MLHHFGAAMQRAKRMPPVKRILGKTTDKQTVFSKIASAIRRAAKNNQNAEETEEKAE